MDTIATDGDAASPEASAQRRRGRGYVVLTDELAGHEYAVAAIDHGPAFDFIVWSREGRSFTPVRVAADATRTLCLEVTAGDVRARWTRMANAILETERRRIYLMRQREREAAYAAAVAAGPSAPLADTITSH